MSLGDDGGRDQTAELRALAHPTRLRILSLLTGADLTAAEIARELDLTHANASYHLRHLLACGLIDTAGEERIRGGVARRYRYDVAADLDRPDQPVGEDARPSPQHRLVYAALAAELRRRSARLRRSRRNYLADAELWLDPERWREIRDRIATASDDLHRAARPPGSPGTVKISTTVALFEMVDRPR
nr:helix-turn-helix domain-containing protein [Micromonospora sp. DSM 115978]